MRSYPIYAQQLYAKPRSKDGTIVCANCHLVPNSVGVGGRKVVGYDDALFVGVRLAGYDTSAEIANPRGLGGAAQKRERSSLRGAAEGTLGGVVVLPEGFKILSKERLNSKMQSTVKGLFVQPWGLDGDQESNFSAFITGPVKGITRPLGTPHFPSGRDLLFPILTPQSDQEKNELYFGCCPVYVGAARGRGQVYPSGTKSSANSFEPSTGGKVVAVAPQRGRLVKVLIKRGAVDRDSSGSSGLRKVKSFEGGLAVKIDETLSGGGNNIILVGSNNGGFGQGATYVYLQSVNRVQFTSGIGTLGVISQIFLVSKKKQFEKVQGAERIF